jgi:hypothetical protein
MKAVFQIVRDAFLDVWGDVWTVLACNLLWTVANLLIVPGPPATLALVYYANRLAHDEVADLGDFWRAFLRYWGPAWRWGSANLAVIALLLGDLILTGRSAEDFWSQYLQGLYLALLAGWLVLQFFALPFLFEQETMSVRMALQNGAVMIGRNPGFAVALTGLLALLLLVGTLAFMLSFAFGAVLIACAGNRAVLDRLEIVKRPGESI